MAINILIYVLGGLIIVLLVWMIMIERRLRKFFAGKKAESLEGLMIDISDKVQNLKDTQVKLNDHLVLVDKRLGQSIRNIQTVRFNPFIDAGSNQSFAMSFLNDEGNGVIVSSLYARDRMSIFAKPITNGKSEFELTIEEKEVLEKSK
ncbi:MAG: DUF4446 family protein [Patescibacteria group bacterium]|nr:DUF4446 family protein [Patescibacteria group bacterium]